MKKIFLLIIVSLVILSGFINFVDARVTSVRGYVKPSTGRYVAPHFKTTPNKTKIDNFSAKGNSNLFTGKNGTVNFW